ncbi:unnamed protein product, partial [Hymenolepis diminuta]
MAEDKMMNSDFEKCYASEFPSEKVNAIELIDDQVNEVRENSNTAMHRMASKEPTQFKILGTRAELELPMIPGMPETRANECMPVYDLSNLMKKHKVAT